MRADLSRSFPGFLISKFNSVASRNEKTEERRRRVSDSQRLDELTNLIVIAGGNENHPTALYTKR